MKRRIKTVGDAVSYIKGGSRKKAAKKSKAKKTTKKSKARKKTSARKKAKKGGRMTKTDMIKK